MDASILLMLIIAGTFTFSNVDSHGAMVMPINWFDHKITLRSGVKDYIGMKSGLQCMAGGDLPSKAVCPPNGCPIRYPGASCYWYKNYTKVDRARLFDPQTRTYNIHDKLYNFNHPWRSPGRAPIDSPCGVAGGNLNGCKGGPCNLRQGGYKNGIKAEDLQYTYNQYVTSWKLGEVVEVAWAITANHGGGYSYRLCKLPDQGISGLTEECFQKTPLDFVGNFQWVQYGEDKNTRVAFLANRTRTGTFPKGSQWTKNPIPACNVHHGGFYYPTKDCPTGTQFPPPKPNLYGFGTNSQGTVANFKFSIVDKVLVPTTLTPGKYILSFRWDCEQTTQVWNTCASIHIN